MVKLIHKIMDDLSAHIIGYRQYLMPIYIVLTLNDILGRGIFVSNFNNECSN